LTVDACLMGRNLPRSITKRVSIWRLCSRCFWMSISSRGNVVSSWLATVQRLTAVWIHCSSGKSFVTLCHAVSAER